MTGTAVPAKTLIMGVGNPILTDDAVGIRIAQCLKEKNPQLEVVETSQYGISLLDYVCGYDRLIIIDSIKAGGKAGELYKLELADLKPALYYPTSHGVDIATAFNLGQKLGYPMPQKISIYAIEIENNTTFAEGCTPVIEDSIPAITEQIMQEEGLSRS